MQTPHPIDSASDSAMQEDVDALASGTLPTEVIVTLGRDKHEFQVRPLVTRQMFPFLALARPIFTALTTRPSSPQRDLPPAAAGRDQGGEPSAPPLDVEAAVADGAWMLGLFEQHGPSVVKAIAVALVDRPADKTALDAMEDRLGGLEVVDLVVLAKHVVTVNVGFFAARGLAMPSTPVFPGLSPIAQAVAAASAQPSPTPSS